MSRDPNAQNREPAKIDVDAIRKRLLGSTHDPRCMTLRDPELTYDDGTPMGCDCRILHRLDAWALLEEINLLYRFVESLPKNLRADAERHTSYYYDWPDPRYQEGGSRHS